MNIEMIGYLKSIQKHSGYLLRDFRGEILFLQHSAGLLTKKNLWTIYNIVKCFFIGVSIKLTTRFVGNTVFIRHQMSRITIGKKCLFNSSSNLNLIGLNHKCIISTHSEKAVIEIGDNCGFSGTVIGAFNKVKIGNNVRCGANTIISDFDWHLEDPRSGQPKDVIIGDNVWLGVNCNVLKGVKIGENTLIGANSLLTRDIPANVIAAGNPCKVIKEIKSEIFHEN